MNIFQLFFIKRQIRKGLADPNSFLVEQATDFFKNFLIVCTIVAVLILTLLAIFGLTSWFGGPFGLARFLFWLLLIIIAPVEIFFISLFIKIRKFLKRGSEQVIVKVKSKVIK